MPKFGTFMVLLVVVQPKLAKEKKLGRPQMRRHRYSFARWSKKCCNFLKFVRGLCLILDLHTAVTQGSLLDELIRPLLQNVHLVELGLLFGRRRLLLQQSLPPADYYYLLLRGDQRPNCQVYRWTLRQPLPTLPVPLRSADADLHIDLAVVFTTAYKRGRFFRRLNYQGPVPAFLRDDNRRWCEAIIRQR